MKILINMLRIVFTIFFILFMLGMAFIMVVLTKEMVIAGLALLKS